MLFPLSIIDAIVKSVYWSDRMIRSELSIGLIAGENDYSSNLTSQIRRQINAKAIPGLNASSFVLKPRAERLVGADACIVFSNTKEFKIGIFEAKWPKLSTHKNCWDSLQQSTGGSHFDSQLSRQKPFSNLFAIWEMFYVEHPFGQQPHFMPDYGSACVWHEDAYRLSTSRGRMSSTPWDDQELSNLLTDHMTTIEEVIKEICECRRGFLFKGRDYLGSFDGYKSPREILVIEYSGAGDDYT